MKNFKLNSKVEIAPLINPVKLSINITQMNVFCQVGSPIVSCQLMALCGPLLNMPNILCIIYKLLLVYLKLLLYLMLLVFIISLYSYFVFDFINCYY